MATIAELKDICPPGYNLAALVPLDFELDRAADYILHNGVPVLKEAAGPLGVIRALEIRMGPLQRAMAEDGEEHRVLHLVPVDGQFIVHDYRFKIWRQ